MKSGYSNWRKLDNAALAFPPATDKNDTRVFRMYCELKETVDPEILQTALVQTMEKYPLFQVVLRKGLFWFYLERREIRAVAKKEVKPPCSRLYIPDKKALLFEVSYYENRINFEVYHALTDGTGARNFLQELVQKDGCSHVEYKVARSEGPDHDKTIWMDVYINGKCMGHGTGKNKKSAAQKAAKEAMATLQHK